MSIACGRFVGTEVKAPGGRVSDDQRLWHAAARNHGALIAVCDNVADAVAALERARLARCPACGHVGAPSWEHFQ